MKEEELKLFVLVNEVDDYSCKATLQSKNMVLEMSLTGPMSIIECNVFFKMLKHTM